MKKLLFAAFGLAVLILIISFSSKEAIPDYSERTSSATFEKYTVNLKESSIRMYLNNSSGENYGSFAAVKDEVESGGEELIFATNGGMYHEDKSPVGLFVDGTEVANELNADEGEGNFFMEPNGVFYLSDLGAGVVRTEDYPPAIHAIRYATQSGPMLLIDGKVNSNFIKNSDNVHIRSGVCAVSTVEVIFMISHEEVNFYDFATVMNNAGCENALYLDGYISRFYGPEIGFTNLEGEFGPIIAVTR